MGFGGKGKKLRLRLVSRGLNKYCNLMLLKNCNLGKYEQLGLTELVALTAAGDDTWQAGRTLTPLSQQQFVLI